VIHEEAKSNLREAGKSLAVQALTYVGSDPERARPIFEHVGLGPQSLRATAGSPGFLAAVLEHVASDEALLIAFAAEQGVSTPPRSTRAPGVAGGGRERESP